MWIFLPKNIIRLLLLTIITSVIIVFFSFRLNRFFNYDNITQVKNIILDFGLLAPIIIITFYTIFNVAMMPTLFFNFLAGYLYGIKYGFLIAWIGMTLGLLTSFLSTRFIFRDEFKKRFGANRTMLLLEQYIAKYKGFAVLFFRLLFIFPYNIQNITYGLSSLKTSSYLFYSAIGIIPVTILHVLLGNLINNNTLSNSKLNEIFSLIGIASIIGIILLILVLKLKSKFVLKNDNQ